MGAQGVADRLPALTTTSEAVQDMNKLALSILACGYLCNVYTDARGPVFVPLWNYACNQGGPNPDYVYLSAGIDGAGVELVGRRGTVRFVEILASPRHDGQSKERREANEVQRRHHDLDDLTIADDARSGGPVRRTSGGSRRRLVAAQHRVGKLLMRARRLEHRDRRAGRDQPAHDSRRTWRPPRSPQVLEMGAIKGMMISTWSCRYYREHHGSMSAPVSGFSRARPGDQALRQHPQIADDEARSEFPVPTDCTYWQILVADDRFSTVDWVSRSRASTTSRPASTPMAGFAAWSPNRIGCTIGSTRPTAVGHLAGSFYRADDYRGDGDGVRSPRPGIYLPHTGAHATKSRRACGTDGRGPVPPYLGKILPDSDVVVVLEVTAAHPQLGAGDVARLVQARNSTALLFSGSTYRMRMTLDHEGRFRIGSGRMRDQAGTTGTSRRCDQVMSVLWGVRRSRDATARRADPDIAAMALVHVGIPAGIPSRIVLFRRVHQRRRRARRDDRRAFAEVG